MPTKTRINGQNYSQLPRLVSDDVILKGLPQTPGAPDGYGDLAAVINAQTIADVSRSAFASNPHSLPVMATPPTVTANNTTLPAGQTTPYLKSTFEAFFRISGGTAVGVYGRIASAYTAPTGGNAGLNNGANCSYSRSSFIADSIKVSVRLSGSTVAYRFIIDGQYASLTGTNTTGTTASANQYITLDFTSAGGRKVRNISVECMGDQGFIGAYVGATEKLYEMPEAQLKTACIGDSYCYGSSATLLGDGVDAVMADYLGWADHMNSGSGGTGWVHNPAGSFNFLQRIQNGDLALNGGVPDVICFQGSINDKNATAEAITANCLAGLIAARSYAPNALFFVFGVWPATAGTNGTLSIADNEAAIAAAVTAFNDSNTFFVPINGAYAGAWLTGTGTTAAPAGAGNADAWMFDTSHLGDYGCLAAGRIKASSILHAIISRA
jgi:hypothetical protein